MGVISGGSVACSFKFVQPDKNIDVKNMKLVIVVRYLTKDCFLIILSF